MTADSATAFDALVGRRIVEVDDENIILDDGSVLHFTEERDCCAGADFTLHDYDLTDPPVITAIEDSGRKADDDFDGDRYESRVITLLGINGTVGRIENFADAGNGGYYFAVLTLTVRRPDSDTYEEEVVVSA